jgi:hypothetical protein
VIRVKAPGAACRGPAVGRGDLPAVRRYSAGDRIRSGSCRHPWDRTGRSHTPRALLAVDRRAPYGRSAAQNAARNARLESASRRTPLGDFTAGSRSMAGAPTGCYGRRLRPR